MSTGTGSPRLTQPPDPLIGTQFAGKYKIVKKLGEGGMGSVYQATQQPIDRMVAIKVLLGKLAQDEVAVKRFEQEARAVSKMQHPNTVTIFDYGTTEDDRLYIVMEFLRGKTLSDALRGSGGGIEVRRTISIIRQVCASLGDAHAAGIIHRDLKPDNIFLTEMGGTKDWVKVLDFGVAKMADAEGASTLTQTGMIFGTPKYMSPEQAEGKPIDYRADIYAIGVVMYEMLVGRPPFLADTPVALLLKHISEAPKPFRVVRPDLAVSGEVEAVVMKALSKGPEQRYSRVEELVADLDACLAIISGHGTAPNLVAEPGTQPAGVVSRPVPTEVNPNQAAKPDLSPADLRPPSMVPSGLSLGVVDARRAPTEPAPPSLTGATGAAPYPPGAYPPGAYPPGTYPPGAYPPGTYPPGAYPPGTYPPGAYPPGTYPPGAYPSGGYPGPGGVTGATGPAPRLEYRPDPSTMAFGSSITPHGQTGPVHAGPGVETLGGVGDLDLSRGIRAPEKTKTPVLMIGGAVAAAAGLVLFLAIRPTDDGVESRPLASPAASPSASPTMEAAPSPSPTQAAVMTPAPTPTASPTMEAAPVSPPAGAIDPRPRRTPVATASPSPTVEKAPRVVLRFDSVPSKAIVELSSGEQLGQTPFEKEFLKGADVLQVVFKLSGYEPRNEIFSLASDRSIKVELKQKIVETAPETPKASPTVAATPKASPTVKASPKATPSPTASSVDDKVDDLK